MPRPPRNVSLTPGQASYVLERLMRDRRVSANDVERYVGDMRREIDELETRLQSLRAATGGGSDKQSGASAGGGLPARRRPGRPPRAAGAASPAAVTKPSRRGRKRGRSAAITPERLASRQLQGRYLSLVRRIPRNRRNYFSRLAKEKGREAAIKEMQGIVEK